MQSAALLLILAQVASSFVVPIKLAQINLTEQAEVATLQDNVWTTTVIIGNPGQKFNVMIDTSSSFLDIPDVSTGRKSSFNSAASSTYSNSGHNFTVQGYYGPSSGVIGIDQVILGESLNASITVAKATFGQATKLAPQLPKDIDGVLGLAFPPLAPRGSIPVFESAIQQKDLAAGIFVLWLEDQYATSDNGTEGVIYYGNNDYLHCKVNQRHVYPLSSANYFQFTLPSITSTVNGTTPYTYRRNTQTIIDSTSPYIAAPPEVVASILGQLNIPKEDLPAIVPCNTKIDLAFNFQMDTEHVTELNLVYKHPDGTCVLGLIESYHTQFGQANFELGYPFLRGRCTYFDVAFQKIGFSDPITHGGHNDK